MCSPPSKVISPCLEPFSAAIHHTLPVIRIGADFSTKLQRFNG